MATQALPQRKKRPSVPVGMPAKRCPGPFCQGQLRPLTEFYFCKSGRDAGKPRGYCKECDARKGRPYKRAWRHRNPDECKERNIRRRRGKSKDWRYYGYVPFARIEFAFKNLHDLLGPTETAKLIGVTYHCVWRWRTNPPEKMRKEYAARILQVLLEVRRENGNSREA